VGYPRVDQQFDPVEQARAVAQLAAAGLDPSGRQVVVYAPTWRQASDMQAADDSGQIAEAVATLTRELPERDWLVVLRVHDKALPYVAVHPLLARHLAPESVATNALLGVADTLVTDYSSVFFDHLATGSRVLFLTPDRETYAASRGLYLADDELPGPVTSDHAELARWIRDGDPRQPSHASPAACRQRFCPDDDGHATARVLAAVFGT
jgi:CDP-glycerol glycerophosphotransferase